MCQVPIHPSLPTDLGQHTKYISLLDVREGITAVNFDSVDFNVYGARLDVFS